MKQKQAITEYLDRENLLDTWSEHFRGVEIKSVSVSKVPREVIQSEIKNINMQIKDLRSKLQWLKTQ